MKHLNIAWLPILLLLLSTTIVSANVQVSYGGEASYRYATLQNTTSSKLIVTFRYSGKKMPIAIDGTPVSGTETITLEPGQSSMYGGHSEAISSITVLSSKVDNSAQIQAKIAQIEQQIANLGSDDALVSLKNSMANAANIKTQISSDMMLSPQDRQHLINKINIKIQQLNSRASEHNRKKAALLAELEALKSQLR